MIYVACEHRVKSLIQIDGLTDCPEYMYCCERRELGHGLDLKKYLDDNPDITQLYLAPNIRVADEWAHDEDKINLNCNRHGYKVRFYGEEHYCQTINIKRVNKKIQIGYSPATKEGYISCYDLKSGALLYTETFSKNEPLNMRGDLKFEEKEIFYSVAKKYSYPNYTKEVKKDVGSSDFDSYCSDMCISDNHTDLYM